MPTIINRQSTFTYRILFPKSETVLQVVYDDLDYAILVVEDGIIIGEVMDTNEQELTVYILNGSVHSLNSVWDEIVDQHYDDIHSLQCTQTVGEIPVTCHSTQQ
jgi:hypothetical protein